MPTRISELDPVININGGEFIPVYQGGVTKKATVNNTLGYKVYRAQLTYNTTTSQLTVNVLQDTFLDIVVSRIIQGAFQINSDDDQFTANKTLVFIGQNNNKGNVGAYNYIFYTAYRQNTGRVFLNCRGVNLGENDVNPEDLLTDLSIEIRVYP